MHSSVYSRSTWILLPGFVFIRHYADIKVIHTNLVETLVGILNL